MNRSVCVCNENAGFLQSVAVRCECPLTLVVFLYDVQEMLKCSKGEGTVELEEALATMLDIIKSVNDSMHQIAITGFEVRAPGCSFPSLPPSLPPSLG